MEREYIKKKENVIELITWIDQKGMPKQNSKNKLERNLAARRTRYQNFYRNNGGTYLPDDLLNLLLEKGIISSKEDEIKDSYQTKLENVQKIISWYKKTGKKPSQYSKDSYEKRLGNLLSNYQKHYRNPKNGLDLPKDLLKELINLNLITTEEEVLKQEQDKKEQDIKELISFYDKYHRNPNAASTDEEEKKLAILKNNIQQYYRGTGRGVKISNKLLKELVNRNIITKGEVKEKAKPLSLSEITSEEGLRKYYFGENITSKKDFTSDINKEEIRRVLSAINEDWILLEYEDETLDKNSKSMKDYILSVINRYRLSKEDVAFFINLSKEFLISKDKLKGETKLVRG